MMIALIKILNNGDGEEFGFKAQFQSEPTAIAALLAWGWGAAEGIRN